jgi:hypothetical protein
MAAQKMPIDSTTCPRDRSIGPMLRKNLHMLLKFAAAICNRFQLHQPFSAEIITACRLRRLIASQRKRRAAGSFKGKAD